MRITLSTDKLYTERQMDDLLFDYLSTKEFIEYIIRTDNPPEGMPTIKERLHDCNDPKIRNIGDLLDSYFSELSKLKSGRVLIKEIEKEIRDYENKNKNTI